MVALGLLLAACPADSGSTYTYFCTNGTAADGTTTESDTHKCASCNGGFKLRNEQCVDTEYTCNNGTPAEGKPSGNVDEARCESCNDGYTPEGTTACVRAGQYFCTNGTPRSGSTGSTEAVHECATCFQGYTKRANNQCTIAIYTCTNGTPVVGGPATGTQDEERCESCSSGFIITAANTCNHAYVCSNGTPSTDTDATGANITKCQRCSTGYILTADETCNHAYICNNGTPTENTDATGDNVTQCESCTTGYTLDGVLCRLTQYTCQNGTARTGTPGGSADVVECTNCHSGYLLTATNSCTNDLDGDGVINTNDVDDDNDGLIEIPDLTALHNMRYNLAGTTYKTQNTGTGSTAGAPTTTNKATDYACSSNSGLCGYELTQDLTFDKDGDGKTFEAKSGGGYTLDSGDNNAVYFSVANDGSGGWSPIGDNTNEFTAIFEGNGYTIRHLAVARGNLNFMGMFGQINGASIHNLNLINGLVHHSGSDTARYMGGLAGVQRSNSTIRTVHANVIVSGGPKSDYLGGLVGRSNSNSIIVASYATGNVYGNNASVAEDILGGLVGWQERSAIVASYATGNVTGGTDIDVVGGLVGYQSFSGSNALTPGLVIASYATGNVDGGAGTTDYVGKLIGISNGTITASYGFGTKSNGENSGSDGTSRPAGVSSATGLTAANTVTSGSCVGIVSAHAYTTSSTCTAVSKTPCEVTAGGTCKGNVANINCRSIATSSVCTATTKSAGVWTTNVWNNAAADTAGAWDFGTSSQTPALKYADYDGSGNTYNCDMFPTGKCNTLIPGQR